MRVCGNVLDGKYCGPTALTERESEAGRKSLNLPKAGCARDHLAQEVDKYLPCTLPGATGVAWQVGKEGVSVVARDTVLTFLASNRLFGIRPNRRRVQ